MSVRSIKSTSGPAFRKFSRGYAGEMTGRIVQVNVSRGGIPKRAIAEGTLETRGFQGDSWAHPRIHGGARQAVLMIASEAIDELAARGYPVFAGALGENLTTSGLDRRMWRAGQRYRVGSASIELTKVRSPCGTLDLYGSAGGISIQDAIYDLSVNRGDYRSEKWGLSGFYARVVGEGFVRTGDPVSLESDVA
jgi:MOSC domain-containing protein YiiM